MLEGEESYGSRFTGSLAGELFTRRLSSGGFTSGLLYPSQRRMKHESH
jgi:hypothetical protein